VRPPLRFGSTTLGSIDDALKVLNVALDRTDVPPVDLLGGETKVVLAEVPKLFQKFVEPKLMGYERA
jgi:hypothetical protein